jgi:superfamily II DNA or RNA helicase
MAKKASEVIETTKGNEIRVFETLHCPQCGKMIEDKNDAPASLQDVNKRKSKCKACDGPLWQADRDGIKRLAVSEYILKKMPHVFDLLIADEVHELKGGNTAQGNSFGQLASATQKTICLTGTLLGGYADDIFYILYRIFARKCVEEGFGYKDVSKWVARYGCLETTTKEIGGEDNRNSRGKKKQVTTKRKPGISPLVFGKFLLESCIFVELADLADQLPDYGGLFEKRNRQIASYGQQTVALDDVTHFAELR